MNDKPYIDRKNIPPASVELFKGMGCFAFLFFFILSPSCYSLVPLESLLLGDFSDQYQKEIRDPLQYIFKDYERQLRGDGILGGSGNGEKFDSDKAKLGLFRGYFEEGFNLENQCKSKPDIQYPSVNDLDQAKRTYLATLQYIGLDLTGHYLPLYAKYFNFNEKDYQNLVENLVGNYCSQNLTTLSIRTLKKNMTARFLSEPLVSFPSIKGNAFFAQQLGSINNDFEVRKKEFAWTLELFKSFCSWGNDTTNFGLMVPFLRSPLIGAAVIREISGLGLSWDKKLNSVMREEVESSVRISCQNLVCRKSGKEEFSRNTPRTVGSISLRNDFERLYCSKFRDADFLYRDQIPKLEKRIKELTFDDQNLMVGHMTALLTGIPDFIVQAEKYTDLQEPLRASMDNAWDKWAKSQNENYRQDLLYEEALTIEVVNSRLYFKRFRPEFSVELDINQGEFDRVNSIIGKLRARMDLTFTKKFLKWARREWKSVDPSEDIKKAERIRLPFRKMMEDNLAELKKGFRIVPFKSGVDDLIIDELLNQLITYEGSYFTGNSTGKVEVPIYFNFGPFALRHLRYRFIINKNEGSYVSELQKLRKLRL